MSDQQKPQKLQDKFQKGYFRLTHQLLKNVKINDITFAFLRLIQTLQIIHFAFRDQLHGQWSSIIFKYSKLFINYLSIDYLIFKTPGIFMSINIGIFCLMLFTILIMSLIGIKLSKQKKLSSFLKSILPFVNFSLYLFKTILQIPVLILIMSSLISTLSKNLNIQQQTSIINILVGILNLILFLLIQLYLITSLKDSNPFSQLIHAGQSITKSLTNLAYKFILTLYLALDFPSSLGKQFIITFTLFNIILTFYRHIETGFYKTKIRNIALKLHYLIVVFTFISLMKFIKPEDQYTIFLFLIISYGMFYLICDWIQKYISFRNIQKQMMFIKDDFDLQIHILHLIKYIDTFEKRQSRIVLQGYLAYHHRQCKLSQSLCVCHKLKEVKQRTNQQKAQFFSFIIDILKQNLNRFTDSNKIYLLLSFIQQYRLKNRFQAIYFITRTLKQNTFLNRLYFYHQINLIQGQMIQDDSKDSSNKAVDINKFFEFSNYIVQFQQLLQNCTQKHISFWKQLLEINTDIKKLQKSGTMVTNSKDYVRQQFQRMLAMNPNNVHTMTCYGKFLIDVTNQQPSNIKYLQKAQSILKNLKQSSKIQDSASKYTDNAQTTIVVISGNQGQLGHIVHTNNYVKKMLGYKRSQCIGTNVNAIMPKIFGQSHNQVLQKYLSTSSDRYNGKQRIVPALGKDGYMIPVVALTKALPNLQNGIEIVGFISKLQQKPQQQQIIRKYYYLLYQSDNEQVVGVSHNCYTQFHIPCCLIYGNPFNNNNELKIRNLFGFSFDKDKQGQVATALQTSQVVLTLNTTKLSEEFIITKNNTSQQIKDDLLQLDSSDFGVEQKIVAKCVLTYNYRGKPIKLLSIYKFDEDFYEEKHDQLTASKLNQYQQNRYLQKTQNDDFKDLKDFKNFISVKSQPSAITIINNICCILMFLIASCIITFIIIWLSLKTQNQDILSATNKSLRNQIIVPNLLFEVQKFYINRNPLLKFNTQLNETMSRKKLQEMIEYIKTNQRLYLPIKYSFIDNYNKEISQFSIDTEGNILQQKTYIDQVITLLISQVQTLLESELSSLYSQPINYKSNPYLLYLSIKYNTLFSIKEGSSQTIQDILSAYKNQVFIHQIVFYILTAIMLLSIILWFITSIPYVLSVSKINNRVLSLFSLIPSTDVFKLINRSYMYMKNNLSEAVITEEQLEEFCFDQNNINFNIPDKNNQSAIISPNDMSIGSPAAFMTSQNKQSSSLSTFKQRLNPNIQSSSINISQKFNKMVNSQNHQKNIIIIQFLIISLLLIGYVLFNHFYSFKIVDQVEEQIFNINMLGKRISILTNVKLFLTQYLMDNTLKIKDNVDSIRVLNNDIIEEAYNLERMLLKIQLNGEAKIMEKYNSGNLCNYIGEYSSFSLFPTQFNQAQCVNLNQGILIKGIKTTIVKILQQVRSILSLSSSSLSSSRNKLLQSKSFQYQSMLKYLSTPMLKIITSTQQQVNLICQQYQLILIICSTVFLIIVIAFWRIIWMIYIEELNNKIWRTKGMLNIIPMRIITANQLLKNQFASGQLEKAVR